MARWFFFARAIGSKFELKLCSHSSKLPPLLTGRLLTLRTWFYGWSMAMLFWEVTYTKKNIHASIQNLTWWFKSQTPSSPTRLSWLVSELQNEDKKRSPPFYGKICQEIKFLSGPVTPNPQWHHLHLFSLLLKNNTYFRSENATGYIWQK